MTEEDKVPQKKETGEDKKEPPKKRKRTATTPVKKLSTPQAFKKRRVSFSTVDLLQFEQRAGVESHGVPDEGGVSLYMGKLISQSPKIQIDKYIEITENHEFHGQLSPEKRIEVLSHKISKKKVKEGEKKLDDLRNSREHVGCQCVPPQFLTVGELKKVLQKHKQSGWSKQKKAQLIERVEKIKGKRCCLPNSGCECVDNQIECYSETCSCLSLPNNRRYCQNGNGKKMFEYPRSFNSRKTQKIIKNWDKYYTPPQSKKFLELPKKKGRDLFGSK